MKINRRFVVKTALVGITAMLGLSALSLWNKSDFCRGWAAHYAQHAAILRTEQALATAENRTDDASTIGLKADSMALIAMKYERVANNPFLAYPRRPLLTNDELDAFHRNAVE